jgi:sugar lactone lactonase YvrE
MLNSPWNIYIEPTSNILYIADSQNHRIQQWFPGSSFGITVAGTSGTIGSSSTLLNTPRDIFVDSLQNIYIADSQNNRIQFYSNGSTSGLTLSSSWTTTGQLWGVQIVNGSIYACDYTKSAVWENGTVVAGNQITGAAANQLNQPQGLAVDTTVVAGTVYVVNSQQHTIVQWTTSATVGTVVAGINGTSGSSSTLLTYPVSIKLDSYSNMFVVDNNNHRIQLFCRYPTVNTSARTVAGTGVLGQTAQTFNFPAGIAFDSSFNMYVSDTSNHRIQKFERIF